MIKLKDFKMESVFEEPRKLMKLKNFYIGFPERVKDAQEIEETQMFDPDFEVILSHLDRILDQIPEKEYDLKKYIIEATLYDPDDIEAVEIVNQGMIKFGPVSQILVQNV